jgi:hypothetical protein
MRSRKCAARRKSEEGGFALLLIFLLAACVGIYLYMQVPRSAFEAQRIRERLLMERGHEYERAIQLYFRKFKRYPQKIEDLEKTTDIRFLRHRYKDPMTGKDEWRILHMGPAGYLTDSLVDKPPTPNGEKANDGLGGTSSPTGESSTQDADAAQGVPGQQQVSGALVRRPSDTAASAIGTAAAVRQQNPLDPNQPFDPNQAYNPNQAFTQQMGAPSPYGNQQNDPSRRSEVYQPNNGQPQPNPAGLPPGVPGQFPPIPQSPGAPGSAPQQPGVQPQPFGAQPQQPGVQPQPFGAQQQQARVQSQPFGVQPQPFGVQPQQPGVQPQPFGAQPRQPGAPQQPTPGTAPGAAPNAALGLINQILTTPRQPPAGVTGGSTGLQMQGGIAGVASKDADIGIMRYHDRKKYNEWEFIYDYKKDKTLGAVAGAGPQQAAPASPGMSSSPSGFGQSSFGQSSFGQSSFGQSSPAPAGGTSIGTPPPAPPQPSTTR